MKTIISSLFLLIVAALILFIGVIKTADALGPRQSAAQGIQKLITEPTPVISQALQQQEDDPHRVSWVRCPCGQSHQMIILRPISPEVSHHRHLNTDDPTT